MTITERIFVELSQKNISQKDFAAKINVNEKTVSAWKKNNSLPPSDKISEISDCLGVTLDYLITGQEKGKVLKLHKYRWNFSESTEADKLYNKVSYALHMLHGSLKANAMMSAVGLPADEPGDIDALVLEWLADKSHTMTSFFTEGRFETGKSDVKCLKDLAVGHDYYNSKDTKADYPEMKKWDENYVYLFNLAVEETTNAEYITEIFEEFSRYPNEHADLMAYIRQGIANFETDRQKRLDRRNAAMNAQKEETA